MRAAASCWSSATAGSAADAAHLAAEFVGRCTRDRRALPAICLTDNTAAVTAIANDYGYEQVFVRQVQAFATDRRRRDRADHQRPFAQRPSAVWQAARTLGAVTVALCGAYDDALLGRR